MKNCTTGGRSVDPRQVRIATVNATEQALAVVLRERREALKWTPQQAATEFGTSLFIMGLTDADILVHEPDVREPAEHQPLTLRRLLEVGMVLDVLPSTLLRDAEIRAREDPQCTTCGHDL